MRITKTQQRWYDLPDDPDGARMLIAHLKPGVVKETLRDLDNDKRSFLDIGWEQCALAVQGFEGFYDADGEVIEYSKNAVRVLFNEIDGLVDFVQEKRNELKIKTEEARKAQEKNLSSTANGSEKNKRVRGAKN